MHLSVLELRHFRNLGIQELDLPPDGVAIVGGNAQGKSNFLEAIYYLETFRSFRGSRDDQVVAFGEELFRVAGTLHDPVDAESAIGVAAAMSGVYWIIGRRVRLQAEAAATQAASRGTPEV